LWFSKAANENGEGAVQLQLGTVSFVLNISDSVGAALVQGCHEQGDLISGITEIVCSKQNILQC